MLSKELQIPLKKLLLISSGIYASQGLIGGMTYSSIPAILRTNGASHQTIGLFFLAILPWAFKFLWAPKLETLRIGNSQKRRSRLILLIGSILSSAIILLLALNGLNPFYLLFALVLILAIVASTLDIACDGFIIEQLKPADRGWGNSSQIGGGYIGYLLGGGFFLWLNAHYGWQISVFTMALLVLLFAIPLFFFREPQTSKPTEQHTQSLIHAFKRREIIVGMVIMLFYDFGIRYAGSLLPSYMVDQGMSLKTIAFISGLVGIIAGLTGTLIGGVMVQRVGSRLALIIALFLQLCVLTALYIISTQPTITVHQLGTVVIIQSLFLGIGFVCIYSFLMGLTSSKQAGVDFTIFQSLDAAIMTVVSFGANYLTSQIGYETGFAVAATGSALAFILIAIYFSRVSKIEEQQSS